MPTQTSITYRGTVYPRDCDHMGHMNVAAYMEKFDNATWSFFADWGLSRAYMASQGIGIAAIQQTITYQCELHPGDIMTVHSDLIELAGKKIRFRHVMTDGETGEVAAQIEQLALCIDTTERKSRPFPETVVARAEAELTGAIQ